MAPSATAVQSKIKRPPGIQTSGINGINSRTSSPSPSMSAGRLPPGAKYPINATTTTSNGISNGSRSAKDRTRRDGPPQLLGRGQRNNSVGLRSASIAGESTAAPISEQPYGESRAYFGRCQLNISSQIR
jgi:transcription factor SPT20